jgi:putative transposase
MARQPRRAIAGFPYHVIQRGHNRQPVFADDVDRRRYLEWLGEAAAEHDLAVHAYVLMDNHVHLICTPANEASLPAAMQALGRRYVRWFNRRHGRSGTLWEGRYRSSLIEADRYLLACQRYVEMNPVRAGVVAAPADWAWSSHRHHAGLAVDPLVRPHPTVWSLGNTPFERESAYRRLFEESIPTSEREWLSARLGSGKAVASDHFQKQLERSRGLRLLPRPVGRPRRSGRERSAGDAVLDVSPIKRGDM